MKYIAISIVFLLSLGVSAESVPAPRFDYEFLDVHSKVILERGGDIRRIADGEHGDPGDIVRTGWRGRAKVDVDGSASHFEIYPASKVRLASETPGVLVMIEEGRLKAWFDALLGREEDRLVETPGAVLAVRGTRYGVEVDRNGTTTLVVFEGMVEVVPREPGVEPWMVRPGELSMFNRDGGHGTMAMPPSMNEGSWNSRGAMKDLHGSSGSLGSMMGPERGMQPGAMGSQPKQPSSGHHDSSDRPH